MFKLQNGCGSFPNEQLYPHHTEAHDCNCLWERHHRANLRRLDASVQGRQQGLQGELQVRASAGLLGDVGGLRDGDWRLGCCIGRRDDYIFGKLTSTFSRTLCIQNQHTESYSRFHWVVCAHNAFCILLQWKCKEKMNACIKNGPSRCQHMLRHGQWKCDLSGNQLNKSRGNPGSVFYERENIYLQRTAASSCQNIL